MQSEVLRVNEGRIDQRVGESLSYGIDTTPWGPGPGTISIVALDITDKLNKLTVTSAVIPGSASANANIITLPKLSALTAGRLYQVRVTWTDDNTNIYVTVFEVLGVP